MTRSGAPQARGKKTRAVNPRRVCVLGRRSAVVWCRVRGLACSGHVPPCASTVDEPSTQRARPPALGDLAQLPELILDSLPVGTDANIDCGSFVHGPPRMLPHHHPSGPARDLNRSAPLTTWIGEIAVERKRPCNSEAFPS